MIKLKGGAIDEACIEFADNRTIIVCSENKTKATFSNPNEKLVRKIKVDGCLPFSKQPNNKSCDYLLLEINQENETSETIEKAHLVELKGQNELSKAVEQLTNSITNIFERYAKLRLYIFFSSTPRISRTDIQKQQKILKNKYNQSILKIVPAKNNIVI